MNHMSIPSCFIGSVLLIFSFLFFACVGYCLSLLLFLNVWISLFYINIYRFTIFSIISCLYLYLFYINIVNLSCMIQSVSSYLCFKEFEGYYNCLMQDIYVWGLPHVFLRFTTTVWGETGGRGERSYTRACGLLEIHNRSFVFTKKLKFVKGAWSSHTSVRFTTRDAG